MKRVTRKKHKNGLGETIEDRFFHYKYNNDSSHDFEKGGVELKVTPYKININRLITTERKYLFTI